MDPALEELGKDGLNEFLTLRLKAYDAIAKSTISDAFQFFQNWKVVQKGDFFVLTNMTGEVLAGVSSSRRDVMNAIFGDLAANIGR